MIFSSVAAFSNSAVVSSVLVGSDGKVNPFNIRLNSSSTVSSGWT